MQVLTHEFDFQVLSTLQVQVHQFTQSTYKNIEVCLHLPSQKQKQKQKTKNKKEVYLYFALQNGQAIGSPPPTIRD